MIVERAPAKLNLALHVRARRTDGYHELETLFAFVEHGDELRVAQAAASFAVSGPFASALAGEGDNLVLHAYDAFAASFGAPAMAIELVKNLPVASGIGGGSADAAAMLRVLARLVPVEERALRALATELGADVPACLLGRTAMGHGRGETLQEVEGPTGMPVLLVNPGVAVSTREVFAGWDGVDRGPLGDGSLLDVASAGRNDLEASARVLAPVIGDVLETLTRASGACLVRMSGSGATCFALYEELGERTAAAAAIRRNHPKWWCLETALV